MKRAIDVGLAVLGLVLLAPILVLAAALIRLDSHGPVVYRGWRVGKEGREFCIYKLRTLVHQAHLIGPPVVASSDPRITRVGRLLRATGIDRSLELLNVIRGHMSLVGPLPEDPAFVALYTPEQRMVLTVRPGITSPALLAFSDEERLLALSGGGANYLSSVLPVKLDLDLTYVRGQSLRGDLRILAASLAAYVGPDRLLQHRLVVDGLVVVLSLCFAALLNSLFRPGAQLRLMDLVILVGAMTIIYLGSARLWGLHHRIWSYTGFGDLSAILLSTLVGTLVSIALGGAAARVTGRVIAPEMLLIGGCLVLAGWLAIRLYRLPSRPNGFARSGRGPTKPVVRTLIYGAGETGQLLAWRYATGREGVRHQLVGFLDDDPDKRDLRVHGVRVLGTGSDLFGVVESLGVDLIVLALGATRGESLRAAVSAAQDTAAQVKLVSGLDDWSSATATSPLVRGVTIKDLLGREPVALQADLAEWLSTRRVLVTGACGSIGSELSHQIAEVSPRQLVLVDNNETGIYDLVIELRTRFPGVHVSGQIGDVTDEARINSLFTEAQPEIVFHVAAYKHVPLMEEFPEEAVRVNLLGTAAVLSAARCHRAERFVLVSTDKAVHPTSVMGATKRVAEMLVTADAGSADRESPTCTAVRFGNVLGSRGSVVPTFARQIEMGGPVTVTHPGMTRYFMDVSEAATLILQAAGMTRGGEIFMLDMGERIPISTLAEKMIRMRGLRPEIDIKIEYTGMRPGEKLHEELAYAGEAKVRTKHPLIHQLVAPPAGSHRMVHAAILRLAKLARTGDRETLKRELMKVASGGTRNADPVSAGTVRPPNPPHR